MIVAVHHYFDLLESATTARREWPNAGRTTQVDIALFGDAAIPSAIIEIKRTNLSDRSLEYANEARIPWFVLDTSQWDKTRPMDLFASVRPLNDWPDLQQDPPRNFEIVRHTVSRGGVDVMTFRWYFDDAGLLTASLDLLSHEEVATLSIPKPSIGNYIYASQTNFTCEMARDAILGKTVIRS